MPKVSLTKKEAEQVREANERTASERIQLNARIASRKLLAEHQPVVFRMLEQALKQDQVPHACLFTGTAGSLKKEMAVLFTQTFFRMCGDICSTVRAVRLTDSKGDSFTV